ncbi:MAG: hypothetical protein J6S14_15705 [Clostridia bacterium]|nr:hypothetical protein [Clostridia bacterium]
MYQILYINQSGQCFDQRDFPESEFDQTALIRHARQAVDYKYAAKVILKLNGKTISKVR